MANADLEKMKRRSMDADGQTITTAGYVCAIIGIVIGVLNAIAGVVLQLKSR